MQQLMTLKAANLALHNIINNGKNTQPIELQNFICLMEVYGSLPEASMLRPEIELLTD
jgi:hypothetical protein